MTHIGMPYFLRGMDLSLGRVDIIWIFFVRAVADLVVQVIASKFYSNYSEWKYKALGVVLFCGAVVCLLLPLVNDDIFIIILVGVTGAVSGWINTAGNTLMLHHWGKKVEPYMQAIHICYGVGCSIICAIVGEVLYRDFYSNVPLWSVGICYLLCSIAAMFVKPPKATIIENPNQSRLVTKRKKNHSVRLFIITFLLFIAAGVEELMSIWQFSWFQEMNLLKAEDSKKSIFYLGSFFWTVYLFSRIFTIKFIRSVSPVFMIISSLSLNLVILFLLVFLQLFQGLSWLFTWLGMLAQGILLAVLFPAIISLPSHYDTWISQVDSVVLFLGSNLGICIIPIVGGFAYTEGFGGGNAMPYTMIISYGLGLTAILLISSILKDFPTCDCCGDDEDSKED
eukprot:TRINITY_DN7390_c0_g1_i1.p1 TRINITY_DN7390_c0_g1~~TRINITY_DN7390_c0_g1_i1.p1  ORF type:complete len:441 (+),score=50.42 TRINITY_DN7390_c0_g1_i1:141-1325(+)